MTETYRRSLGPVQVWRCTEAIDSRANYTFRTIGNPEGRCVEITSGRNAMLFDRRLARELAEAILEICGPANEIPTDLADADLVEIIYESSESSDVVGFRPYETRSRSTLIDSAQASRKSNG